MPWSAAWSGSSSASAPFGVKQTGSCPAGGSAVRVGPLQSLEYPADHPLEIRSARKVGTGPVIVDGEYIIPRTRTSSAERLTDETS